MHLKDKVVVVVGATGGIGSVLSKKLDANGARLILVGRNRKLMEKLIKAGHKFYKVEISNPDLVQNFLVRVKDQPIDVLIYAAGIGIYRALVETTVSDWISSYAVNVTAPFLFIRGLLPQLQKSPDSIVLTIGSGAGVIPMRGRSVYCSTKFALRGLTLSLAEEYAGTSPKFCLITLGSTLTNFAGVSVAQKLVEHKQGRAYFTPDWVADKLLEIIKLDKLNVEYTLYPGEYGFGSWKKP